MNNISEPTVIDATGVTLGINETTYSIPGGVTIKGATIASNTYLVVAAGNTDTVVFENCAIKHISNGTLHLASAVNGANMIFNNCTLKGKITPNFTENLAGNAQFNNCTFLLGEGSGPDGIGYVNCMGGTSTFTGCKFEYTGGWTMGSNQFVKYNAVNAYAEGYSTAVILNGCQFINCGTQRYGSNSTLTVK